MPLLPLSQTELLGAAIGCQLLDITRWLVTTPEDFVARGGERSLFFASCSGPTELVFSEGLVHSFEGLPNELSVMVDRHPLDGVADSERHRLSESPGTATPWLRGCLGQTVRDVRVWIYRDDVPSPEARQAAVSYLLDSGDELFYCTELHGRMSDDELLSGTEVPRDAVARVVSLAGPS